MILRPQGAFCESLTRLLEADPEHLNLIFRFFDVLIQSFYCCLLPRCCLLFRCCFCWIKSWRYLDNFLSQFSISRIRIDSTRRVQLLNPIRRDQFKWNYENRHKISGFLLIWSAIRLDPFFNHAASSTTSCSLTIRLAKNKTKWCTT